MPVLIISLLPAELIALNYTQARFRRRTHGKLNSGENVIFGQ